MKRIACMLMMASFGLAASAQIDSTQTSELKPSPTLATLELLNAGSSHRVPVFEYWKEHDILQHLDLSLTLATTGIGVEVASPIGEYVKVRAGFEFMPRFEKTMEFDLTIKGQPVKQYDSDGNRMYTTFDKLNDFLYSFTGYEVQDHADMLGRPTITNGKFLVDVFPLKENKHWRVTAGFFYGPSKFAEADNTTPTMISLYSVGMYNRMYDKALKGESLFDLGEFTDQNVSFNPQVLIDKVKNFGRLGFAVGYYKNDVLDAEGNVIHEKGERYIVEPGADGMVHVQAKSNAFKPYLGVGYETNLSKKADDWKFSIDLGAMFWGGKPDLYVHDGTNLTVDVENIRGQVGNYVKLFKAFPVYPVLSVHFTKRIF